MLTRFESRKMRKERRIDVLGHQCVDLSERCWICKADAGLYRIRHQQVVVARLISSPPLPAIFYWLDLDGFSIRLQEVTWTFSDLPSETAPISCRRELDMDLQIKGFLLFFFLLSFKCLFCEYPWPAPAFHVCSDGDLVSSWIILSFACNFQHNLENVARRWRRTTGHQAWWMLNVALLMV